MTDLQFTPLYHITGSVYKKRICEYANCKQEATCLAVNDRDGDYPYLCDSHRKSYEESYKSKSSAIKRTQLTVDSIWVLSGDDPFNTTKLEASIKEVKLDSSGTPWVKYELSPIADISDHSYKYAVNEHKRNKGVYSTRADVFKSMFTKLCDPIDFPPEVCINPNYIDYTNGEFDQYFTKAELDLDLRIHPAVVTIQALILGYCHNMYEPPKSILISFNQLSVLRRIWGNPLSSNMISAEDMYGRKLGFFQGLPLYINDKDPNAEIPVLLSEEYVYPIS